MDIFGDRLSDGALEGAVLEWVFERIGGIALTGERHFLFSPLPGGHFTEAEMSYLSLCGLVRSGWKKADGKTYYHLEIPTNCQADIILQQGKKCQVESGTFDFVE